MSAKNYCRQQGLSLIELMISITLGMVLMGAALQVMLSNSRTHQLNNDVSRIQENGRIALDILVKDLRLGGYRQPANGNGMIPDFFLKECTNSSGGTAPCAADGGQTGFANDTLSVQFDPPPDDGTETNCQGEVVPAEDIIVNVYTIVTNNRINSLTCRGYNATTENWTSTAPMPLVDGIDGMQILYGLAGSTANPSSTTRYVSLDQLTPSDWINVRSVRVALLVSNGLATGSAENKNRTYRLLDSNTVSFNDGHSRRIYSTTVHFNNSSL